MLCPQHMLLWNGFFQHERRSQRTLARESTRTFIPSSHFFVCWRWSGFGAFTHTHTHRNRQERGMERPSHWLTTDPWLSFESLRSQIKLCGLKGPRCHSAARGHSMSLTSSEGLTRIFLSCQGRVMGGKEKTEGSWGHLTHKYRAFEILNWDKKDTWLKSPNVKILLL